MFGIGLNRMVRLGTLLNPQPPPEIPDGAIKTLSGEYIKTLDGEYIIAGSNIPENALMTLDGDYIKTLDNEFIII